jgi:hypothetical protein
MSSEFTLAPLASQRYQLQALIKGSILNTERRMTGKEGTEMAFCYSACILFFTVLAKRKMLTAKGNIEKKSLSVCYRYRDGNGVLEKLGNSYCGQLADESRISYCWQVSDEIRISYCWKYM